MNDDVTHYGVLKAILVDMGIEEEKIAPTASLRNDLKLDSTETVDVSLELKRRLGVDVKLESKQELTVDDVCRLIDTAAAVAAE